MTWRCIKSDPPPKRVKVLMAMFAPGTDKHGFMAVDKWHCRADGDKWDGPGKFNEAFWPATHWMPLPEPPEGDV